MSVKQPTSLCLYVFVCLNKAVPTIGERELMVVMFACILNIVVIKALGTIRFSRLLLLLHLLPHLIHGAGEQQASDKEAVKKLA